MKWKSCPFPRTLHSFISLHWWIFCSGNFTLFSFIDTKDIQEEWIMFSLHKLSMNVQLMCCLIGNTRSLVWLLLFSIEYSSNIQPSSHIIKVSKESSLTPLTRNVIWFCIHLPPIQSICERKFAPYILAKTHLLLIFLQLLCKGRAKKLGNEVRD